MKAIRIHAIGGREVLRLEDIPVPVPAQGQLLVRIEAVGLNFIEVYHRTGLYKVAVAVHARQRSRGDGRGAGPGRRGSEDRRSRGLRELHRSIRRVRAPARRARHRIAGRGDVTSGGCRDAAGNHRALSHHQHVRAVEGRHLSGARRRRRTRASALSNREPARGESDRHGLDRGEGGARPGSRCLGGHSLHQDRLRRGGEAVDERCRGPGDLRLGRPHDIPRRPRLSRPPRD